MNFSDFITHHGKRVNKEHFIHLIQVSKIDGKIGSAKMQMLHKEGKKFGLTDPEIDKFIASESHHDFHPPYSLKDKFYQLYNIAEMILADEVVTDAERKMVKRYAIAAGFSDKIVDSLLDFFIEGISKGVEEDKLLNDFKKKFL